MQNEGCVIFNPAARSQKASRFNQYLGQFSHCQFLSTTGAGTARTLAAQAVHDGFETIIAAGGDGTVNEVLNGIGDVPGGFERTRLAVIPLGTVNVFALEIGIPADPTRAWNVSQQGRERMIDLPEISFAANGGVRTRYFLQMAGAGLDARAIELADLGLKKRIGPLAYVWAAWKALMNPQGLIQVVGDTQSSSGTLAIASNGKLYGGKFILFPEAQYTDGLLDVCVFPKVRRSRLPFYAFAAWTGRLSKWNWTVNFRAETVHLSSADHIPIQVDGEAVGHLPATIRVHPRKMRIVAP